MKKLITLVIVFVLTFSTACEKHDTGILNNDDFSKVGDIIQFGGYDWKILEIENDKALILSDKILMKESYHSTDERVTWEGCDLRQYLNGTFYENIFTIEERNLIIEMNIKNTANQWYGINGGVDTTDKIFLLSLEEVVRYFGDSGQLVNIPADNVYKISDEYDSKRVAKDKDSDNVGWWLRSPGARTDLTVFVDYEGKIQAAGHNSNEYVDSTGGVRPALWIKIE